MNFIISILIGIALGMVSGLVPGMHPNFFGAIIIAQFSDWWVLPTFVSMLASSQFFEYIRSTFLFIPEEGNVLAMHPIFKFVKEGKSLAAIKLSITGLLSAILIGIIISPILVKFVPFAYKYFKPFVPYALLIVSIYLILKDKNRFGAAAIFIMAGVVGYFGLKILNQPLLILLTGFFGFPILLQIKNKIPRQIQSYKYKIEKSSIVRGSFAALISSFFLTFIPAVGPSQASLFSRGMLKKRDDFLISIGAISGFDIIFSTILLFSVGKARIGVLEMLGQKFTFNITTLILVLLLILAVGVISYFLTLKLGMVFSKISERLNYRYVAIVVGLFILGITIYFDGGWGVGFLAAATSIGILANKLKTNISNCMGSLVIPVLFWFFN